MISDYYTQNFTVEAETTDNKAAIGSWAPTWATLGTFKGWMDYLTGRESLAAAQFIDKATHMIGCSSTNSWILPSHRIKDSDSKIYRVLHVDNPIRRDHHLEIILEYNESDNLST
jgi:hypothetical protein